MKQISIQITDETARQIARLSRRWGLPRERHNTAVIERAIATIFMLEIGYEEYQARLEQMQRAGDSPGQSITEPAACTNQEDQP
jgi:hypothetical protein